jgi:hypothetical protein
MVRVMNEILSRYPIEFLYNTNGRQNAAKEAGIAQLPPQV